MKAHGKHLLDASLSDGYGISLGTNFVWGSNMVVANNGISLLDSYYLTKDKAYKFAAKAHLDYLLGKNPMAISYVTGHGTTSPTSPHHRPSVAKKKPMPGMLVGDQMMVYTILRQLLLLLACLLPNVMLITLIAIPQTKSQYIGMHHLSTYLQNSCRFQSKKA